MKLKPIVGALAALALTTAPAHADNILDPNEQAYADNYGTDVICVVLAAYPNPGGVLGIANGIMHDGFAADSAVDIINYAVETYCPKLFGVLVQTDIYLNGQQGPLRKAM